MMLLIQIRLWLVLLLLAALIVFFLQNTTLVALVFFSTYKTLLLPIAAWVILFTAAGIATSLCLQLLYRLITRQANRFSYEETPSSPTQAKSTTKKINSNKASDSTAVEDEWNIEEPPEIKEESVSHEFDDKETQPEPKVVFRSGSVYSYSYRTESPKKSDFDDRGGEEDVKDANYRVLKPPYQNRTEIDFEQQDDEEDWI